MRILYLQRRSEPDSPATAREACGISGPLSSLSFSLACFLSLCVCARERERADDLYSADARERDTRANH